MGVSGSLHLLGPQPRRSTLIFMWTHDSIHTCLVEGFRACTEPLCYAARGKASLEALRGSGDLSGDSWLPISPDDSPSAAALLRYVLSHNVGHQGFYMPLGSAVNCDLIGDSHGAERDPSTVPCADRLSRCACVDGDLPAPHSFRVSSSGGAVLELRRL